MPLRIVWLAFASTVGVCLFGATACRDGEVSRNQVCRFQCDYRQDGTVAGFPAEARLTERDVLQVIANALVEANANNVFDLTIVVNDHLNNVLAVFDSDASTIDYSRITSRERPGSDFQAVHQIGAADPSVDFSATTPSRALDTALDGIFIPNGYAAISKAGTANYFSTQGNAFSTRTASNLIQQNFFPGETDRPGGPLFGVQIAQLACSDINTRQTPAVADLVGPRRLPVGFAADPGGLPLYKDGIAELDANGVRTGRTGRVVVGSVGIEYNGIYSVDKNALGRDANVEERIAVAATRGFEADRERRASRITVAGRALRYVDDAELRSRASSVPTAPNGPFASEAAELAFLNAPAVNARIGAYRYDEFFFPFSPTIPGGPAAPSGARDGVFFLDPTSGVVAATITGGGRSARGEILTDGTNTPRFPSRDTTTTVPPAPAVATAPAIGDGLSAEDVDELLVAALLLAENTRAQTRTPLGGPARVDVAVVDPDGELLGFARSQDALLDGIDVTIAKTRTAAFWSKAAAQAQLLAADDPLAGAGLLNTRSFVDYVNASAAFLSLPAPGVATDPPFNGDVAWSSIALGGISNPDFPPGVASGPAGPLSREPEASEWSIFSTGIQTEVVLPGIALALCEEVPDLANVLSQLPGAPAVTQAALYDPSPAGGRRTFCQTLRQALIGTPVASAQPDCLQGLQDMGGSVAARRDQIRGLQNGFHIFQGAVPIYRRNTDGTSTLVGAYGVSGDGAEQDDFVPFVALDEVAKDQRARGVANEIGNAPGRLRADNISVANVNLRYVVCPTAPFLSSNDQSGCEGR